MNDIQQPSIGQPRFSRDDVSKVCERILGRIPDDIDDLSDLDRKSAGATVDGRRVFVTRRDSDGRAALEAHVLRTLHGRGAPVPKLLGIEGRWLIQESLGEIKLSSALRRMKRRAGVRWLDAAIESLAAIHEAARETALSDELYRIGANSGWLDRFMAGPHRMGAFLGVSAPRLETAALARRLSPGPPVFIKWDARPPNAMPRRDDTVAWFDWEHCGCRNPLDDLAWFLGDESVPEEPDIEETLLTRHLARFSGDLDEPEALLYLRAFGALHMVVRLSINISEFARGIDANRRTALAGGQVGPLPPAAIRLCRRGARWADQAPETLPLADWFREIENRFSDARDGDGREGIERG